MSYDKKLIFKQSKEIATKNKLLTIQDVIDHQPISKSRFYDFFPDGSDELDELRKIIDHNKVIIKTSLRAKWYNSDNATLQMALYKLAANEEEHRKLQQNYTDITTKGDKIQLSETEAISRIKELESLLSDDQR